ncbi:hypothetical protein C6P40_003759 [Pichia californica]|uniref:RRM domain-containing protein n=1 Tax=Pichia californica TaxID=460514 RepID=A0A9P7BHZ5_9ASCO|nr:hypothetical protein C6P42_001260 [[Candida] californica]KAG0690138.1 hypothetical protein C6P40_003759 [[Candida] californica]
MLGRTTIRGFASSRIICTATKMTENSIVEGPKREPNNKALYVSQLPFDISKDQLTEIFKSYGPIQTVYLPLNKGKENSRRRGRVIFENERNARRASIQMQGYVINNVPIKLTLATDVKVKKEIKYDIVMLKNLPYDSEEEEIMKILRPYQALRIGLPRSHVNNECLGYGYVRFASPHAAERAIEKLKNIKYKDRKIRMHMAEHKQHNYKFVV